mmetsp:Transcript_124959/g.339435  ORF Transcript_124959/g.339435 Transcript_124959/m.339435 type:complete len:220 (-) Transcript_124959:179-838(-)
MVALRMHFFRSATEGASPLSRYASSTASSCSTAFSTSSSRYFATSSSMPAGISSFTSNFAPSSPPSQISDFCSTRSYTPSKFFPLPMGSWIGTGSQPSWSFIIWMFLKKSAPSRSILFTKQIRGTLYLFAWRHTVSLWGSTPATPSNTATAPSNTRRERSTSRVKSTCPGVSTMLMRWPSQKAVVAALVMVIPRSRSCSIQSMVASPSWTSPIDVSRPV